MIFSGIPHSTAALFHMRDFLRNQEKTLLYIDSEKTLKTIETLAPLVLPSQIKTLQHASEIFTLNQIHAPIILLPSTILKIEGNREGIKRAHTLSLKRGEQVEQTLLIEKLLNIGFLQSDYPGEIGTYKRDGSIIRIMTDESEWVIEYFDTEIESIMEYRNGGHTHHECVVFSRMSKGKEQQEGGNDVKTNQELLAELIHSPLILLSTEFSKERTWILEHAKDVREYSTIHREGSTKLHMSVPEVHTMEDLKLFLKQRPGSVHIYTKYEKKLREFLDFLELKDIPITHTRHIFESFLFETGDTPQVVLGDDIFGKIFIENRVRKSTIKHLDLLLALKEGDLVVHREHGIGKYISLLKKRIGLIEREYMEILYAEGDKVFLPLTELGRITKYVGESDEKLSRLEGKEWEKTLSKTDEEVQEIAEEILSTEAKRKLTKRIPFGIFRTEEEAFLRAFPYVHTPDQKDIIQEIFQDMEGEHPMDRLISGDVGFGKTEVAMNAIYKAVLSGMQVAVISPLLILAEEHKETFEERLGAFGVRIGSLTRLTRAKEEKEILKKMKTGAIDVIVGTHRLLSEDVLFRKLGLLIIDEEHRFGVGHKEAIKKMKAHIDILSLSATPIPRSLNLALSGLKKISLLSTPPPRKKPIETIVIRWDEAVIRNAIELELKRGGQIIILHNRIRALPMIEKEIREILDDGAGETLPHSDGNYGKSPPRIVITHGQMPPQDIEERIHDFKHGKYDILLTTTVIENGVNFLGANTIIVSDAEEFGLAQLHQIRGRVGRKDVSGKCYLMYRKYELSELERERLIVLSENSGLGSGYEIALRDMQIRGTGDILGFRQSGKSKEVGISLYFQLLEEKIETMKSGKRKRENTKIELDLSYVLPEDFFDSDMDKLSFFREIEAIETLEDLDRMEETFLIPTTKPNDGAKNLAVPPPSHQLSQYFAISGSEHGEYSSPLQNLFLMMRASIILTQYSVAKVSKVGQNYHFDFFEGTRPELLRAFLERFDSSREMIILSVTKIRVETKHWKGTPEFLRSLCGKID